MEGFAGCKCRSRQLQPVADKGEWRGDYLKGEQQHEGGLSRS